MIELVLEPQNGAWPVQWELIFANDDIERITNVEWLVLLKCCERRTNIGFDLFAEWESAVFDDEQLLIPLATHFPGVLRVSVLIEDDEETCSWYAVHQPLDGFFQFFELERLVTKALKQGFEEPLLWG